MSLEKIKGIAKLYKIPQAKAERFWRSLNRKEKDTVGYAIAGGYGGLIGASIIAPEIMMPIVMTTGTATGTLVAQKMGIFPTGKEVKAFGRDIKSAFKKLRRVV